MNIVILDGYTLNPGDLSWEGFEEIGNCQIYDRTAENEIIERSRNAEVIIINKVNLHREIIHSLPKLKYIGVLATGYNTVDTVAAYERKIPVTNIPIYGTSSVAQMVFALLLELTNHSALHSDSVFNGQWGNSPDFCYWIKPLIELDQLTMGIVGYGRIGSATANIAHAFGMNVLSYDNNTKNLPDWAESTSLERLLKESDVVSLHCPVTQENIELINSENLSMMKKSAFLINTSRGKLIDEKALAEALNQERIAGAGLDVLSIEPPSKDNPLLKAKNCIITPHISWTTKAARTRLMDTAVENLKSFINGNPQNVVNS
jgi:glycerate dehydrogenase